MIQYNGQNQIKEVHYDGHDIKYIYGGCSGDMVWQYNPPIVGNKLEYTTTTGDTFAIPCNSSSTLTHNELILSMHEHGIPLTPYYNYEIHTLVVGDCVTNIDNNCFNDMWAVTSITIPNSVVTIGYHAFTSTAISAFTIPNSVTSIGQYAFGYCSGLTSIELPSSVATIGDYCFDGCSGLTSVDIGSGITSIGGYAFYSCDNITSMTIRATVPPTIAQGTFGNETTYPIYVPAESVSIYQSTWSNYASRIRAIT